VHSLLEKVGHIELRGRRRQVDLVLKGDLVESNTTVFLQQMKH